MVGAYSKLFSFIYATLLLAAHYASGKVYCVLLRILPIAAAAASPSSTNFLAFSELYMFMFVCMRVYVCVLVRDWAYIMFVF